MLRKLKIVIDDIIRTVITNISGVTGRKIRYWYWSKKFKKCGKNVIIDEGVIIQNPQWISIGDNVWIDKYSVLMAGPVDFGGNSVVKKKKNNSFKWNEGELIIGNEVHIGMFNIIQAHAGVYIGDKVTTSAGVKIYSLSNYPFDENNPALITYANYLVKEGTVAYILSPIVIEEGVWIGLNSIVLGGCIGKNSFIASNSIVLKDIPENSYAAGNPAQRIKPRFKMGLNDEK
uniref:Acyltransferase n=1 Tax=Thermodesulfobacterium geofontis TaxID=1295609 RepID=A0A7C4NRI9_9BACT